MNQTAEGGDERCPSGVEGLDEILGGVAAQQFYLSKATPARKTTLALQFLWKAGGARIFTLPWQNAEELLQVAQSHGWSLEGVPMLVSSVEKLAPEAQTNVFILRGRVERRSRMLLEETRRRGPRGSCSTRFQNFG